jgi:putative SOS response-associated peptidase YedK
VWWDAGTCLDELEHAHERATVVDRSEGKHWLDPRKACRLVATVFVLVQAAEE